MFQESTANQAEVHAPPRVDPELLAQKITKTISFKVISDRKINLTKPMAEKHILLPAFSGERELRTAHVDDLLAAAKAGSFLFNQTSIASCICEWDGVERRLNGQHTAWMRTYMPEDWECNINSVKYSAPTEDDFRRLYGSIDRGAPRSRGHIIVARVYDTEGWEGVNIPTIKLIQGGLNFWLSYGPKGYSSDKLATLMTGEYMSLCLKVATLLSTLGVNSKTHLHLRRGSVVAAMFATTQKSREASDQFWKTVADGLNVESNEDARYKLREFLFRHRVDAASSVMVKIQQDTCNSEGMYRICINAWNRWRAGESVRALVQTKKRVAAK